MLVPAQEAQDTTNNQDHQTQPEEPNEQPEHVLQTIDNNATEDQATKIHSPNNRYQRQRQRLRLKR